MKKVIGLVGLAGSGKGTVGDYLISNHNFRSDSFAATLKDAVSSIFRWDRALLEGNTLESRQWRETIDEWWSGKLGRNVTPRWVLQYIGTDVLRTHFNIDIWIYSLEKKLQNSNENIVLTDVRFPNEISMVNRLGGEIWWVRREPEPTWMYTALTDKKLMPTVYPDVHKSEYEWIAQHEYRNIKNNSSLENLYKEVDKCLLT